jgi:hypothetical protein
MKNVSTLYGQDADFLKATADDIYIYIYRNQ